MNNRHELNSILVDLISSDYTIRNNDTDLIFKLNHTIHVPEGSHLLVAVKSFNMIYATHLIQEGINDSLTITTESVANGVASYEVIIAPGNYQITELLANINQTISTNIASLNLTSLALTISDNLNSVSFVSTYTETPTEITMTSTAYIQLGLEKDTTAVFAGSSGTFPKWFDCTGNSNFYVRLPNLAVSNINTKNVSNIITSIPIVVLPSEMIYYEVMEPIYSKAENIHLNELHVQILNQDMQPLGNLRTSSDWRISLIIHFEYDFSKESDLIKKEKLIKSANIDNTQGEQDA